MPRDVRELADLATPMAVRVAATLGLADRTGGAGATLGELAHATATAPPALKRLLDHLVAVGVFVVDDESGRYRPTEVGAQLRADAPGGVLPLLDMTRAGGRAELAFVELLHSIRTNQAAYPRHFGRDFWSDLDADPRLRRSFDDQMIWRFATMASQIAERHDWGRFPRILDVGGGVGTLLTAILAAHPGVGGMVLDLAPTAEAARARIAQLGLDDRAGAVAGSFFDPLPTGFDAYLVSDILHDWDDENARAVLSRCREAARASGATGSRRTAASGATGCGKTGGTGTVVVIEPVRGRGTGTAVDLFMLMCFGGGERSVDELTALSADSGLALRSTAVVADGRTALEFVVS